MVVIGAGPAGLTAGALGVTRAALPKHARIARHDYGIGPPAPPTEAPPSADCAVLGVHPHGFAGAYQPRAFRRQFTSGPNRRL